MKRVTDSFPPSRLEIEIQHDGHTTEVAVPRGGEISLDVDGSEVTIRTPELGPTIHGVKGDAHEIIRDDREYRYGFAVPRPITYVKNRVLGVFR